MRPTSSGASVMQVNKRDVYAWLVRDHVEMREAIYEFLKVQSPQLGSIKAALVWVSMIWPRPYDSAGNSVHSPLHVDHLVCAMLHSDGRSSRKHRWAFHPAEKAWF